MKLINSKNLRDFIATCINAEIKETANYLYKLCSFGELRLWKKSGRISTVSAYSKKPKYTPAK